jgi:hypothetical protein
MMNKRGRARAAAIVTVTAGGAYPQVFNNDLVDANFGVTSRSPTR